MSAPLIAPHAVTLAFARSVGGATESFLRGLAAGRILGSRMADGRVVVPPVDHDARSGEPARELVAVAETGEVRSYTWVAAPRPEHPLDEPFGFALVALDGADTALVHVVAVDDPAELTVGMRVRADWRAERIGDIRDIRAFVPEGRTVHPVAPDEPAPDRPLAVESRRRYDYTFTPGHAASAFFRSLAAGRITGGRCASCDAVYVPPHDRCPACGTGPLDTVEVAEVGTIVSFAVCHLPVAGFELELPFAWAWIRLDGADVPFAHLLGGMPTDAVAVGGRVRARWAPAEGRPATWEAIEHFAPEGS